MMSKPPKHWPCFLPFLTEPAHNKLLSLDQRSAIGRKLPDDVVITTSQTTATCASVRICPIEDKRHPAYGQYGLLANRTMKAGTFVLLYLGTVHGGGQNDGTDAAHGSDYDLWLDREAGIAVDAADGGNEARFINDYRGVADQPNAEFREVWSEKFRQRCMAVFVLPVRLDKARAGKGGIRKGQEILGTYFCDSSLV